jgi:hypothetical protein
LDLILAKKETTIPEFSSCSVKGRTLFWLFQQQEDYE